MKHYNIYEKIIFITIVIILILTINIINCNANDYDLVVTNDFVEKISFENEQEEIIKRKIAEEKERQFNEDLDLLARVINAEAGCNWFPDEFQMKVGNVVLNRVKHSKFPNSIKEVIYADGQYQCVTNGSINNEPSEKCLNNARRLLEGDLLLPENVIYQAEFKQGKGVYETYYDEVLNTTTYFCY